MYKVQEDSQIVAAVKTQYAQVIEQFKRHVSQNYPQYKWDFWVTDCMRVPCIGILPEGDRENPDEMFPLEDLFEQDGALTPGMHDRLDLAVHAFSDKEKWLFVENGEILELLMSQEGRDDTDFQRQEQILIQTPGVRFKAWDTEWEWGFGSRAHLWQTLVDIGYLIGMEHARHGRADTRLGQLSRPKVLVTPSPKQ